MRFGDPECQVLVPRLASDLYVHCHESRRRPARDAGASCATTRASASCSPSEGYPPAPTRTRRRHRGPRRRGRARRASLVFHAGHARRRRRARRDQRRPGADRRPRPAPTVAAGARPRVRGRGRDLVARPPLPSRHRRPGPSVIPRYSLPEIADLFTDEARFGAWLEVEVLAVEAWAELGVVPGRRRAGGARAGRRSTSPRSTSARRSPTTTSPRSSTSCRRRVGPPAGAWVHYGLTSSDVVDTALALQMTRALDRIIPARPPRSRRRSPTRAREFRDTPMVGRTHGIHAEPTTFGAKLALWAMQVRRDRERLAAGPRRDRGRQAVGRGRHVLERRSRGRAVRVRAPRPAARARDAGARRATGTPRCMYACASLGATIESFALEIRHLQRTEVREAEEPFREGEQKGSSAMPHKRNPVKSEQLSRAGPRAARQPAGRARRRRAVARARHLALVGRAHHRPRLADARVLHARAVHAASSTGLRVYPERMLRNLDASFGLVFSQPVLLALVEAGAQPRRRVPHRAAQRDARVAGGALVPRAARRRSRGDAPRSTPRASTPAST